MATVRINLELTTEGKALKMADELNEAQQFMADALNDLRDRQYITCFNAEQVAELQSYIVKPLEVAEWDGYYFCYVELSNSSRKELREIMEEVA